MAIDLSKLNDSQREAVTTIEGPVQIQSVAGSGKTTVLTKRISYMIMDKEIDADNILVATFTKKAANEMKERLEKMMPKREVNNLFMGTLHSIGYRILKAEYKIMNHKLKDAKLISGNPQKWLIEEIMKKLNIKERESFNAVFIMGRIAAYKNELITPDVIFSEAKSEDDFNVAEVYKEYERTKIDNNVIDFDDMIYKLYFLFLDNPAILTKYQKQIQYLLIDEVQDNNKAQNEIIKMIAYPQNNVFVVGDDDQSVYSWRGARPDLFINFKNTYPDAKIIKLETNYRSLPAILEAANTLIKCNTIRAIKTLVAFFKPKTESEGKPVVYSAEDEDDEADIIVREIETLKKDGMNYKEVAVLYRTNAQSRALEDACIKNRIPYVIQNGISFYERKEIKDIIAYLKLAVDIKDKESFERIINVPSRFLGAAFIKDVENTAFRYNCGMYEALDKTKLKPYQERNIKEFKAAIKAIQNKVADKNTKSVGEVIDELRKVTKYDSYLKKDGADEEDNDRIENVNALSSVADKYSTVKEFLEYINIITSCKSEDLDAVQLMTLHKSKGLEYQAVFMAGVSEGLLPHKYALQSLDVGAIEEERRLGYVGITRAQQRLVLTTPESFMKRSLSPSRFIREAGLVIQGNPIKVEETQKEGA